MRESLKQQLLKCRSFLILMLALFFKSGAAGRNSLLEYASSFFGPRSKKWESFLIWSLDNYRPRLKAALWEPSSRVTPILKSLASQEFFNHVPLAARFHKPKVAFIRRGAMGDVLLAEPCIREFARRRPGVELVMATDCPIVYRNHPNISRVISTKSLKNFNQFSAIFDLDGIHENQKEKHITHAYKDLIVGEDDFDLQPKLFFLDDEHLAIKKFIETLGRPFCVVHNRIDQNQPFRNVELTQWFNLLNKIGARYPEIIFLQAGLRPNDVAIEGPNFLDIRDQFTVHELALLIAKANLFIGTDAGPLHIAGTTNTPILSFFTYVTSRTRRPLRLQGKFFGIDSSSHCAGCWTEFSRPDGWYCKEGDNRCSENFNMQLAYNWACEVLG